MMSQSSRREGCRLLANNQQLVSITRGIMITLNGLRGMRGAGEGTIQYKEERNTEGRWILILTRG